MDPTVLRAHEATRPPEPRPSPRVAVVIPCYRVRASIGAVLAAIGPWAAVVYCVDDGCPDRSGDAIEREHAPLDPRVRVVRRAANGGVGAAVITGYLAAIEDGADVLVKIDGDGQMDPRLAPALVQPILDGDADYVKGNRFFSAETVARMPWKRIVGNAGLSFMSKLSTGYWDLFDPTNGFTALDARVARVISWDKLHPRYFFESDLLFRLGVLRARVVELPATAVYGDETSHLSELRALVSFPGLHLRNLLKRIAYNYFLRNFSVASVSLLAGLALVTFGVTFGTWRWIDSAMTGALSSSGTVMLAALPVLLGIQLLLQFLAHDVSMTPTQTLHRKLSRVQVLQSPPPPR